METSKQPEVTPEDNLSMHDQVVLDAFRRENPDVERFMFAGSAEGARGQAQTVSDDEMWAWWNEIGRTPAES